MANDTQPLTVYFSLSLLQIMDVVSRRASPRAPAGRVAPGRGACLSLPACPPPVPGYFPSRETRGDRAPSQQ